VPLLTEHWSWWIGSMMMWRPAERIYVSYQRTTQTKSQFSWKIVRKNCDSTICVVSPFITKGRCRQREPVFWQFCVLFLEMQTYYTHNIHYYSLHASLSVIAVLFSMLGFII
jgi:hypothetical protein